MIIFNLEKYILKYKIENKILTVKLKIKVITNHKSLIS